ncbi:MAG: hypothetical protein ABI382_01290 [Nakamurella sp.]
MKRVIAELVGSSGGVIGRRDYPELAGLLDDAAKRRELVSVLPGVYAHPDVAKDWRALVHAVSIWDKSAVIVGEAAAALTYWPELVPRKVEVAGRRARFRRPGIEVSQRRVPDSLVATLATVAVADPALTAIDLVPTHGGDSIDRALRSRMTTLAAMHKALELTTGRIDNGDRRRMLLDSRGKPWSEAERFAHRKLRAAGLVRWHANVPIVCHGQKFYQDIVMDDCPLVIEVDGKIHLRPDIFESDRYRGNALLLAGRYVLHFTWKMLHAVPDVFIPTTLQTMEMLRSGK